MKGLGESSWGEEFAERIETEGEEGTGFSAMRFEGYGFFLRVLTNHR